MGDADDEVMLDADDTESPVDYSGTAIIGPVQIEWQEGNNLKAHLFRGCRAANIHSIV